MWAFVSTQKTLLSFNRSPSTIVCRGNTGSPGLWEGAWCKEWGYQRPWGTGTVRGGAPATDPGDVFSSRGDVVPGLPCCSGWSPFGSPATPFLVTVGVLCPLRCLVLVTVGPDVGGLEANGTAMSSAAARLSGRTWHGCV